MHIDPTQLIYWFNAIRDLPDDQRTRMLDAFWSGQINSKVWLVDELNKIRKEPAHIYVFGGWVGTLSSMLLQASTFEINKINSIDIDPWCEPIANRLCEPYLNNKFKAVTMDMSIYNYDINPDIVINTSTEHVSQDVYDWWYDNVPSNTLMVIQGNDFFNCPEHVRCSRDLTEFKEQNYVSNVLFEGSLVTDMYTRFMCIWTK
jgi:hypothetical protein